MFAVDDESKERKLTDKAFFAKRHLVLFSIVVVYVALGLASSSLIDFDIVKAITDLPQGFVWFVVKFLPTAESFEKIGVIFPALWSTFLAAVSASCAAAALAYLFAVIGSRSVGLGGAVPLMVRIIASLFRNIPMVAWAFLFIYSFKQSEFTGALTLFLWGFGFLTRSFLENIDETSAGPIEALRASGATYLQIIMHAVVPMTVTQVISWTLYTIETCIRSATLVGMLTGTGIGFVFNLYYRSFRYDIAGLVLVLIIILVLACEALSNYVRRQVL
jgi:phosphonate transport system permease protein